jgi:hypothetical protein
MPARISINTPFPQPTRLVRQLVPGASVFLSAQIMSPAAYYNGNTYIGYIDGDSNVRVAKVNKATKAVTISPAIKTFAAVDQHSAPAILVRSSDHKIIVVTADVAPSPGGNGNKMYQAISTNAEDVSAWGAATDISASLDGTAITNYTYMNLQQLSGESGKIYLFYSLGFPGATNTISLKYVTSTDGGATWSATTNLWTVANKSSYWSINSDDTSRIDFAVTDGHVLNGQTSSLYHFYYDGTWHNTAGTSIGSPTFSNATTNMTKVYDGPTNGNIRVPYAIHPSGPTIVFAAETVSNGSTTAENYWYAKFSGGSWTNNIITTSGIAGPDNAFAEGGVMIDPADTSHVLVGKTDVLSYRTANGGTTWANDAQLTTGGTQAVPNIRPFAPHNADPSLYALMVSGPWPLENSLMVGQQILGYPA